MMIVAPSLSEEKQEIEVPSIEAGKSVDPSQLTVEVTKTGEFFINAEPVDKAALTDKLQELAPELLTEAAEEVTPGEEKLLVVRADKATKSQAVLAVFDAARDSGFRKVTVAGEPLSGARQKELSAIDDAVDSGRDGLSGPEFR